MKRFCCLWLGLWFCWNMSGQTNVNLVKATGAGARPLHLRAESAQSVIDAYRRLESNGPAIQPQARLINDLHSVTNDAVRLEKQRTLPPPPGMDGTLTINPFSTNQTVLSAEARYNSAERLEAIYQRLERGGYLTQPARVKQTDFERAWHDAFEPSFFRIGPFTGTFTVWTAIERKNPLWLISPIIFNISW